MLYKHIFLGKIPFSLQRYDFLLTFANIFAEKCQKSAFLLFSALCKSLLHVAELGFAEAEKLLGFLGFLFVERYRERLCLFEFADNLFNAFDGGVVRKIRCFHTL